MRISASHYAMSITLMLAPAACSAEQGNTANENLEACLAEFFDLGAGDWDYIATTASADGGYVRFETKISVEKTGEREWLSTLSGGDMDGEEITRITFLGDGKVEHRVLGETESVSVDTYTECHEPDSRGRRKAVSTYNYMIRSIGKEMNITSTAYASGQGKYVIEDYTAADGSGDKAFRTLFYTPHKE